MKFSKTILVDGSRFSGKTYYCKNLAYELDYDYQTGLVNRKELTSDYDWIPMWYGSLFVLDYIRQLNKNSMRGVIIDRSSLTSVVFNNPLDHDLCMSTFKKLLIEAEAELIILNPSDHILKRNIKSRSPELYSSKLLNELLNERDSYLNVVKKFSIPCLIENLN